MTTEAPSPAEPAKLSVQLERGLDRLRIVSARRQWGAAAFLLVWLSGWTLGCIVLLGAVIFQFSFFLLLFAIPFWAAELFVFSLVGMMIASREEVTLDQEGLAYRWTVWRWPVARRRIPLGETVGISGHHHVPENKGEGGNAFAQTGHRLTLQTVGAPLQLPGGATEDERRWLGHVLEEMLTTLKRYYAHDALSKPTENVLAPADLPAVQELRPPSMSLVAPPSDSTWSQRYDFDTVTFLQRGNLSLGGLGMLLFVNAFWNGATGVFVTVLWGFAPLGYQDEPQMPQGSEWWFLFFFLIPFQLIGLAMFTALVLVLIDPLRRSRWIFKRDSIDYRLSYLGLGRTWPHEVRELDRLELRKNGADASSDASEDLPNDPKDEDGARDAASATSDEPEPEEPTPDDASEGTMFTLAFIDRQGADVCKIEDLSLGEACWMADVVLRERAGWFR